MLTLCTVSKGQPYPYLLVVDGNGPSLLGRDWLIRVRLDWQRLGLYHLQAAPPTTLQQVLTKHKAVFRDELGLVDGITAKIHVDPSVQPRFCKNCPICLKSTGGSGAGEVGNCRSS